MKTNFIILIFFGCAICTMANTLNEDTKLCSDELHISNQPAGDQVWQDLFRCVMVKQGAIVGGIIQPDTLTRVLKEIYPDKHNEVIVAVNNCKSFTNNDIDVCLEANLPK